MSGTIPKIDRTLAWTGLLVAVAAAFMSVTAIVIAVTVPSSPVGFGFEFGAFLLFIGLSLLFAASRLLGDSATGYVGWVLAGLVGLGLSLWLGSLGEERSLMRGFSFLLLSLGAVRLYRARRRAGDEPDVG